MNANYRLIIKLFTQPYTSWIVKYHFLQDGSVVHKHECEKLRAMF